MFKWIGKIPTWIGRLAALFRLLGSIDDVKQEVDEAIDAVRRMLEDGRLERDEVDESVKETLDVLYIVLNKVRNILDLLRNQ